MAQIMVTAAMLTKVAEQLENLNGQFKGSVGKLTDTVTNLKSMWEGDAETAFQAAFNNDKGQMDSFYVAMTLYIQTLRTIAAKYAETEAKNAEIAKTRSYK